MLYATHVYESNPRQTHVVGATLHFNGDFRCVDCMGPETQGSLMEFCNMHLARTYFCPICHTSYERQGERLLVKEWVLKRDKRHERTDVHPCTMYDLGLKDG